MKQYVVLDRKTNSVMGRIKCTSVGFDGELIVFYFGNNRIAEFGKRNFYYSEV